MATFRGFIAIDIDVSSKIIQFQNEINKTGANVKLVEPKNIHITLKFLGDTEEALLEKIEKIMENAVKSIDPFNIQLKGTGVFPNQNYIKVVWIGMDKGEQIGDIAGKIDESLSKLGFEREKRGFSSHLTIARVRNAKNKEKLVRTIEKYNEVEFAEIKVNSITLKKSELTPKGPIYTTLKEIPLSG
jgi:2'-5' RNA ligase